MHMHAWDGAHFSGAAAGSADAAASNLCNLYVYHNQSTGETGWLNRLPGVVVPGGVAQQIEVATLLHALKFLLSLGKPVG